MFAGYMHGVNFGCWLCQCDGTEEHYETHITEADFHAVRQWGCDHVRIPFSYVMVTAYDYRYLDRAVAWAKAAGLNAVLDMHVAPHYNFDHPDSDASTMFHNEAQQADFAALWREIALHYQAEGANVTFELLNEVTREDDAVWNRIIRQAVEAIRSVSPERNIILGGTNWSKIDSLERLALYDDSHVIYTWHAYEPYALTHQRASWWKEQIDFDRQVSYPDTMTDYDAYFDFMGFRTPWLEGLTAMDSTYLERYVGEAAAFAQKHHVTLYCGEFGCIGLADEQSRRMWHRDIIALLVRHQIGYAVWNYRDNQETGGFALTHMDRSVKDQAIIDMLGAQTEEAVRQCC